MIFKRKKGNRTSLNIIEVKNRVGLFKIFMYKTIKFLHFFILIGVLLTHFSSVKLRN